MDPMLLVKVLAKYTGRSIQDVKQVFVDCAKRNARNGQPVIELLDIEKELNLGDGFFDRMLGVTD